jgi:peptidoglycan/LPS O-acetylase OafA/YrhL
MLYIREPSRQFNNAVHAMRAFAALMVFSVHLCDSFNTYFFPTCAWLNEAMPFIKRFGTFGVELFFVISGYVIMSSLGRHRLQEFALRRLVRIYPVFAFLTQLFFAGNWFGHVDLDKLSFGALLANLSFANLYFGTPALSPNAWSLTFEANFYAIAGLAYFLMLSGRTIAQAVLALAALSFLIAFPIASYFAAGCLLYAVRGIQPRSLPLSVQFAVFAGWCFLAATIDHESPSILNAVLLFASAIFFFVVTTPNGLFARLATLKVVFFVGTISYSFYLVHPYAYLPLRVLFQMLRLESWGIGTAAAVYFPTITVAALFASYIVYRLLEDAPYRAAFGESVFEKTKKSRPAIDEASPVAATTSGGG